MTDQNRQQANRVRPADADPDLARRVAGLSKNPAGPEPPGTGYASHPDAGTAPAAADMGAPEGPETERGGSPSSSSSRTNEDEGACGRS
jgi:hypothetical protein